LQALDGSWDELSKALAKPDLDMDGLLIARDTYLRKICTRGLFGAQTKDKVRQCGN
jgi:hypothetical protein